MLSDKLQQKLNRLTNNVGELHYSGADPNEYCKNPFVAVVGTRKPTPYGKRTTETLVKELVRAGVVIVSGLAIGIDGIAHKVAVEEQGITIAVLPSGLKSIYPASHQPLANDILRTYGTLVSEYNENHKPRKREFLERNRIIAALADAVIIPEAAANSGSLNTANHAHRIDIPLFAVPGQITSPMSAGTNFLLKGRAKAITEASDLFDLLGLSTKTPYNKSYDYMGDNEAETLVLQKISGGITNNHELQIATKLPIEEFQTTATMLEIAGRIVQDETGSWRLS